MRWWLFLAILAACGDDDGDIRGPFTGEVHRFYLTSFTLPIDNTLTNQLGTDLDNDDKADNALGTILTALGVAGDLTDHGPDMIASGAIASYIEIQADDLENDSTVGVTFFGKEGDPATVMGGAIKDGAFISNRTVTTSVPGAGIARLPVFEDANPVRLPLEWVEIDLGTSNGGYDAVLRGGLPAAETQMVAYEGVLEMMTTNPQGHTVFQRVLDADMNGELTVEEVSNSSLLGLLLRSDLKLDGEDYLSFAFGAHFAPDRVTTPPGEPCADRIKDGDESDIDCGGTDAACPRCTAGAMCVVPEDCQTGGCVTGRCRAATCTDGVRDGFEGDVDCGAGCPKCTDGQRCAANPDCTSNSCTASVGTPGTCVP